MSKEITVFDLCCKTQKTMEERGFSRDTIRRYEAVFNDFITFSENGIYSQHLGITFLVDKLSELGGIPETDDSSHLAKTYGQCVHVLAEYYNFGLLHSRRDYPEEIVWPRNYRKCVEEFLSDLVESGLSHGYYCNMQTTLKSLILLKLRSCKTA